MYVNTSGRILGALNGERGSAIIIISSLLENLDSAPSPSIARPALSLAWEKPGDCSGLLPLTR